MPCKFIPLSAWHCCRFGPLVRHWTMRYEAKHNYFKKMSQNIGNYINISWTLAMRHQYLQCYYALSGDNLFDSDTEIGPGRYYNVWFHILLDTLYL